MVTVNGLKALGVPMIRVEGYGIARGVVLSTLPLCLWGSPTTTFSKTNNEEWGVILDNGKFRLMTDKEYEATR